VQEIPVDPKNIVPFLESTNYKLTQKQVTSIQTKIDGNKMITKTKIEEIIKESGKNILNKSGKENYLWWVWNTVYAQLHEISGDRNISITGSYQPIVIANIGHIDEDDRKNLNTFKKDKNILNMFQLNEDDLNRIIEVNPFQDMTDFGEKPRDDDKEKMEGKQDDTKVLIT